MKLWSLQTAVIDLRDSSVSRSPVPNPVEQPLELHHGFSQLNVYLPLAAEEHTLRQELRIVSQEPPPASAVQ